MSAKHVVYSFVYNDVHILKKQLVIIANGQAYNRNVIIYLQLKSL